MTPAPFLYLAAAVAGAVLGAAAQASLGWHWWLVAAGVVAAVWLFFASTALWAGGRSSPSLGTDLLRVVSPGRAMARDRRRQAERFRSAPFPLYGLPPSWRGPRHLGGWEESWTRGRRRPVTTAIDLAHGDPLADQGPILRAEVRVDPEGDQVPDARSGRRRELAEELWFQAAPPAQDPASHLAQVAAARRRPDPAWTRATIPVDGQPVDVEWLAEGRHWVARAELNDHTLTLHARDLPLETVELVRVTDLDPYVEGQHHLEQRLARQRFAPR